uniref:NadR/Ttd14 AAA domain-containing protein n=1 Tax=Pinguiococcus pyrenoidosus TaxID=172671 RepID=A0A7R9U9S5_9STRA|mmetsp:Transcript_2566/g.10739  ORF Transcript_2566/g.10739 Transcript_2566/m.10739 type:complete len:489 (+) Transcript_2566:181-1647(+)
MDRADALRMGLLALGGVISTAAAYALLRRLTRKGDAGRPDPLNSEDGVPPIFKFVLTGGPCAGKTTSLMRLSTFLRDRGFLVYVVPEAATLLFTNGVSFKDLESETFRFGFQWSLMETQMNLEDAFERIARAGKQKAVLICDRGAMDGKAYMDKESWDELLVSRQLSEGAIREHRYHAVFHMVTAADGASTYYNLDNPARRESAEAAVAQDAGTQQAWLGHPHHIVIDNEGCTFEGKLQRLLRIAARLVGLPSTERAAKKFVLKDKPDMSKFTVPWDECIIEKVYLRTNTAKVNFGAWASMRSLDPDEAIPRATDENDVRIEYVAIRKRSQNGFDSFGQTEVSIHDSPSGPERRELKRILTRREYHSAKTLLADPARCIIRQKRISFIYKNQSCHINQFLEPVRDIIVFHVQTEDARQVEIPPFIEIDSDVGELEDESDYSAYIVSLKGRPPKMSPLARSPQARSPKSPVTRNRKHFVGDADWGHFNS